MQIQEQVALEPTGRLDRAGSGTTLQYEVVFGGRAATFSPAAAGLQSLIQAQHRAA